jgi:cytochrome P450
MGAALQNVSNAQDVWDRLDAALAQIDTQLGELYERALTRPDRTLMSHVMHGGTPDGRARSFEEVLPTMKVIILGGLQEPGHAAANACAGLLLNPDQARAVAEDPAQHALRAFDEGLRWITPIGVTPRVATEDITISDTPIEAGSSVTIVMASANRDPERFENPDQFDLFRKKRPHLSFGFRPHFCSGHALSRAMGEIALQQVFEELPNLRLDESREVQAKGWRFRGVSDLPAQWDA